MDIETAWYEFSPYLYGAGGITAILYSPGSLLLKAAGFLLFGTVITILALRWINRHQLSREINTDVDQKKYEELTNKDLFYDADQSID